MDSLEQYFVGSSKCRYDVINYLMIKGELDIDMKSCLDCCRYEVLSIIYRMDLRHRVNRLTLEVENTQM
jgi:hypothetical protein